MYSLPLNLPTPCAQGHQSQDAIVALLSLAASQYELAQEALNMFVAHYCALLSDVEPDPSVLPELLGFPGYGTLPPCTSKARGSKVPLTLYAGGFVFAINTILTVIDSIAELSGRDKAINDITSRAGSLVKKFKPARDSLAHIDERVRGFARGKPIKLKPIHTRSIKAEDGILFTGAFINRNFVITTENGLTIEIEISASVLDQVRKRVEELAYYLAK